MIERHTQHTSIELILTLASVKINKYIPPSNFIQTFSLRSSLRLMYQFYCSDWEMCVVATLYWNMEWIWQFTIHLLVFSILYDVFIGKFHPVGKIRPTGAHSRICINHVAFNIAFTSLSAGNPSIFSRVVVQRCNRSARGRGGQSIIYSHERKEIHLCDKLYK